MWAVFVSTNNLTNATSVGFTVPLLKRSDDWKSTALLQWESSLSLCKQHRTTQPKSASIYMWYTVVWQMWNIMSHCIVYALFNENSNKFRKELQCSTTCLQCSSEKSDIFLKHGGAFLQENATLLCMKWVLKGFLFQGILHSLFARNVLLFLKKYCKKWCYASTLLSEYTVPHPFKDFFETQTFPSTTASIEESSLLWHFTKNKCFMLIFHMFSLMCSLLSFKHGRLPNSNW